MPPDVPTTWCSHMATTAKKNSKPRCVVDLRALKKYTLRQTHPVEAPFLQACRVPPHTWRSIMDGWNGYHSIPLVVEDCHLTNFLPPWGHLPYLVLPQGYLAAGDAYTDVYDQVTRDFTHPFTRWHHYIEYARTAKFCGTSGPPKCCGTKQLLREHLVPQDLVGPASLEYLVPQDLLGPTALFCLGLYY